MNNKPIDWSRKKKHAVAADGNGKTVILLHGIPSSLNEWERFFSDLSSNGFRPMALDLLGHGDSDKPDNRDDYTSKNAQSFFNDWMKSLKLEDPVILIGHSFGGYLSIKYALENPGKVQALILIDPLLSFDQIPGIYRIFLSVPALPALLMGLTPRWLIQTLARVDNLNLDRKGIHCMLTGEEISSMANDYKKCSPNILYFLSSASDEGNHYAELRMPTLLIWGRRDHTLTVSKYEKLINQMPNLEFHAVNGGHYPHRTHYDEVFSVIMNFLKTNSIQ